MGKPRKTGVEVIDNRQMFTDMQWQTLEYVEVGMSLTSACRKSGYNTPAVAAERLRKTPNFMEEMEIRLKRNRESMKMTRKKVQEMVLEAYDIAKDVKDPNAMVRAASEINKMCGFYEAEKAEIDLNKSKSEFIKKLNDLSDEELLLLSQEAETINPALELQEEESHLNDIIDAEFSEDV